MSELEAEGRPAPFVKRAVLIDDRRIELWWSDFVTGAGTDAAFQVLRDGAPLPLVHWTADMPWSYGTVYQQEHMRTTIALVEPVDVERASDLSVRVTGDVRDYHDQPVDRVRSYSPVYEPYYAQRVTCDSGIVLKASKSVQPLTLEIAKKTLDTMLSKIPEVARVLVESDAECAIFGLLENAYDVPEHRMGAPLATRHIAGYGGEADNPTSSISEANVIRLRSGRYLTSYPNENILVHEYAHAIHLVGINFLPDQTMAQRVRDAYANCMDEHLFPDTYASSNYEEYFATLTQIWFNVMQEGVNGQWDGIRGPVNTREELATYDPVGYALMADLYPEAGIPAPWDTCKDSYDASGALKPGEVADIDERFDWKRAV